MVGRRSEIELSPLDQIRQIESEMTRRIAAARENVEEILENARRQSADLKRQANEAGVQEGQAHYKDIIAEAEEEARSFIAEASARSVEITRRSQKRMSTAVVHSVNIVVGLAGNMAEGEQDK